MISIFSTNKSWIEGTAIQQLEKLHQLDDVERATGLPDLHAGPVGVAVATHSTIYPHIVGSDAGCGMGFWQTSMKTRKAKLDKWVKRLTDLDEPYDEQLTQLLNENGLDEFTYRSALGTIGLGNHFAELQKLDTIHNQLRFDELGLDKECLTLLVHSGSRGYGRWIMDSHIEANGSTGLSANSPEGETYLKNHDYAVRWAVVNRELIAKRFMNSIHIEGNRILDLTHNSVTRETIEGESYWIHRKGANPNNRGVAIVAGSRGTRSYLVEPIGDFDVSTLSIAHGAGRKLKRSEMEGRLKSKKSLDSLKQTSLGGRVICDDRKLLYEEAPEAYKNIEQVIHDLVEHGLVRVIASYIPVITYKTKGTK